MGSSWPPWLHALRSCSLHSASAASASSILRSERTPGGRGSAAPVGTRYLGSRVTRWAEPSRRFLILNRLAGEAATPQNLGVSYPENLRNPTLIQDAIEQAASSPYGPVAL